MSGNGFREVRPPARRPAAEAARSDRLPQFIDPTADADAVLGNLSLGIVGAGSVGRNVADKAARLQIARIYIVDPGRFKPQSLLTHPVDPAEAYAGRPKARSAAVACRRLSPATRVFYFDGPIQQMPMTALSDTDVVVLATDNLAAEAEVAERCVHLRKPLAHAAVHGASLVAQVRLYTNCDGSGPCISCGFSREEWDFLNRGALFSCTGLAGDRQVVETPTAPTVSTAFLCSLAADLAMTIVLRLVLKLGKPLADSQTEFCGYTLRSVVTPLRPKLASCDHTPWEIKRLDCPLGKTTLRALAGTSGLAPAGGANGVSFAVGHLLFAELGACAACGTRRVRRFVQPGRKAGTCRRCGGDVFAQPFYSHRPVLASQIEDVLDKPLGRIGARSVDGVLVRRGDRAVLLCGSAP